MFYTLEKTAEILELSTGDVIRLRESNKLRGFRDGQVWKFRKEDVDKFLQDTIRERSRAADLLTTEDDEGAPTMLADSAAFDDMMNFSIDSHLDDMTSATSFETSDSLDAPEEAPTMAADPAEAPTLSDAMTEAPTAQIPQDVLNQEEDAAFNLGTDASALVDAQTEAIDPADAPTLAEFSDAADDAINAANDSVDQLVNEADQAVDAAQTAADDLIASAESQVDDLIAAADEPVASAESSLDALIKDPAASASAEPQADDLVAAEESGADAVLSQTDDVDSLIGENSALADDLIGESPRSSSVDLGSSSDDDLLHTSNSDSGIALLGELADDDIVLGGGSGSGSSLSLGSSDSGIALIDSESGFDLNAPGADENGEPDVFALQGEDEDSSNFQMAGDESDFDVLTLDSEADTDAPTELGADDSIFELADETNMTTDGDSSSASDIESASQLIEVEPTENNAADEANLLFTVDDEESEDPLGAAAPAQTAPQAEASPFAADDANPFGDSGAAPESPFGEANPFDQNAPASDPFGISAENPFGATSPFEQVDAGSGAPVFPGGVDESSPLTSTTPVASTDIRGIDFLILVPCLIFLILATIGAVELCRTIWSYQEGTGNLAGPILESIAKMVKLI